MRVWMDGFVFWGGFFFFFEFVFKSDDLKVCRFKVFVIVLLVTICLILCIITALGFFL